MQRRSEPFHSAVALWRPAQSMAVAESVSLKEAAERVGVSPATLRRWAREGVIPEVDGSGEWSTAAVAHARIVARLRERGHKLEHIKKAGSEGRLAYGYIEEMFGGDEPPRSLKEAAELTDLEPALIERFWNSLGLPSKGIEQLSDEDIQALHYVSAVLGAGFPLVAFLPLASPMMDYVHQRFLQHFVEQDVVGHMESELEDEEIDLGRVRVAIAFADLAGYTRFTEEEGEEEALSSVERFVEGVTNTLPEDARVVKTIGDAVMVVGHDVAALVDWAVGYTSLFDERPEPRIGVHAGTTLYRDGDYFGRDVNLTSRVVARARGGEVLVSDSVVDAIGASSHLTFEPIGQVKLKGFDQPRELCRAIPRRE